MSNALWPWFTTMGLEIEPLAAPATHWYSGRQHGPKQRCDATSKGSQACPTSGRTGPARWRHFLAGWLHCGRDLRPRFGGHFLDPILGLSLIHISEPTRRTPISYAVFCLKKKK